MDEKINNVKSRTEQANLMGIKASKEIDWGNYSSKTCGSVGGATKESSTKDESSILK